MNSGKLKWFLILLFLAVNLFFALSIKELWESKNHFSEAEIAEAVKVLNDKGVSIDAHTVIKTKKVPETLKLTYDAASIEKLADKIMWEKHGSFKIPNGQNFANDKESFSYYYDFSFEYKYFDSGITDENVISVLNKADAPNEKEAKLLDSFFKELDEDITVKILKYAEKDGMAYIEALEYIEGCEIDEAVFHAVIRDGKAVYASGKLYYTEPVSRYTSQTSDSINILFELEETDRRITKMELIYFPVSDDHSAFYLTPSYRFTYSDSETELYDATSGVKRK